MRIKLRNSKGGPCWIEEFVHACIWHVRPGIRVSRAPPCLPLTYTYAIDEKDRSVGPCWHACMHAWDCWQSMKCPIFYSRTRTCICMHAGCCHLLLRLPCISLVLRYMSPWRPAPQDLHCHGMGLESGYYLERSIIHTKYQRENFSPYLFFHPSSPNKYSGIGEFLSSRLHPCFVREPDSYGMCSYELE